MPLTSETGNRGFTLLELLVVLAILVLLTAAWPFAAPRMFPAQTLRDEGQRLIGALRMVRLAARLGGQPEVLRLIDSGGAYEADTETHRLPAGVRASVQDTDNPMNLTSITFFPDGSSAGAIIELELPDRTVSVQIDKLTGRATLNE